MEFFYYSEPKTQTGTLSVYSKRKSQTVNSLGTAVWSQQSVYDPNWKIAQVSLGHSIRNEPYQVIFEQYVPVDASGKLHNIYIDDVFLRDESCLPRGDCDFENGMCTWSSTNEPDVYEWNLDAPSNNRPSTPLIDHSTQSSVGKYIYFESDKAAAKGQVARLQSETFEQTTRRGKCFTFWFYISGVDAGFIEIVVKDMTNNNLYSLWRLGGTNMATQGWQFGQLGFYLDSPHTVIVQATRGGSAGSVAIDDIYFKESQYCSFTPMDSFTGTNLPVPLATTTRRPTQPTPSALDCDFEEDLCQWKNDVSKNIDWKRFNGSLTFVSG